MEAHQGARQVSQHLGGDHEATFVELEEQLARDLQPVAAAEHRILQEDIDLAADHLRGVLEEELVPNLDRLRVEGLPEPLEQELDRPPVEWVDADPAMTDIEEEVSHPGNLSDYLNI